MCCIQASETTSSDTDIDLDIEATPGGTGNMALDKLHEFGEFTCFRWRISTYVF